MAKKRTAAKPAEPVCDYCLKPQSSGFQNFETKRRLCTADVMPYLCHDNDCDDPDDPAYAPALLGCTCGLREILARLAAALASSASPAEAAPQRKIIVTRDDYVRWNELWLSIQILAAEWGDDGAHGSELLAALDRARTVAAAEDMSSKLPPDSLSAATPEALDLSSSSSLPEARQAEPPQSMADAAEMLWIVLANVSGGDWTQQSADWQEAAARWRDNYFRSLAVLAVPSATEKDPDQERTDRSRSARQGELERQDLRVGRNEEAQ